MAKNDFIDGELSLDELSSVTGGRSFIFHSCHLYNKLQELIAQGKPTDQFISDKTELCKVQSALKYSSCGADCPLWNSWH